jgi:hypothetical protein
MGLVAAQAFRCRKPAPERPQAGKDLVGTWQATDPHRAIFLEKIDLIAFLQPQLTN